MGIIYAVLIVFSGIVFLSFIGKIIVDWKDRDLAIWKIKKEIEEIKSKSH